ncbi:MAG: hypothetical protein GX595_09870 [Lentisphaerae bacterium]|nr:hypothetical protein [Lentisphaerota bacterium]
MIGVTGTAHDKFIDKVAESLQEPRRLPQWDAGEDDCTGAVFVAPLGQLDSPALDFVAKVAHRPAFPVLLLCVYNPGTEPKSAGNLDEALRSARSQLGSMGLSLPVEGVAVRFDSDSETVEEASPTPKILWTPSELQERLVAFAKAAKRISEATSPGNEFRRAVFCSSPEQVRLHCDYWDRVRRAREEFSYLSHILTFDVTVAVSRGAEGSFSAQIGTLCCDRLEIPGNVHPSLTEALKATAGKGTLVPEDMRDTLCEKLQSWARESGIGCVCEINLKLTCPDHETTYHIAQSPIPIEVRPPKKEAAP